MRIAAELAVDQERRKTGRTATDMPAGFRERGRSAFAVDVIDFSTEGCKIEFTDPIVIGDHAWLRLPRLEGWHTRVAWIDDGRAGLDFVKPLHPGVAAMIVAEFGR